MIIQFLDSLNKTSEKYLNSIIEYHGYYILYDLITSALIAFLTAFVIYLFHKKYPKNRENEIIVFAKKGVIRNETLFNKNDIKFLLLKKSGKCYKSYFEAEKYLKQDYEYLTGE